MATHDYVIANGTGAAVRSDLNDALAAIVSNNSSSSEPATTYAYQWWADTTANVLKIRNSANNAWITLRELDGTMLIEDGTASLPGLAFADDTNTGIFSGGADEINIATGGTERVVVNSSGQVGIGTTTAGRRLVIAGDTNTVAAVQGATNGTSSLFLGDTADEDIGALTYNHVSNHLEMIVNAAERVRVDSSGRLGVGITSPTAKLHVVSSSDTEIKSESTGNNALISINNSSSVPWILTQRNDTSNGFSFRYNGNNLVNIDTSGNLGLGTTSPASQLHVNSSSSGQLRLSSGSNSDGLTITARNDGTGSQIAARGTSSNLRFFTTNSSDSLNEQMRITADGDVLVGLTSLYGGNGITLRKSGTSEFSTPITGTTSAFVVATGDQDPAMVVRGNGGIANYSANNANLSDRNLKKDIAPIAGTWDRIRDWEIVNFRYKDQSAGSDLKIGVIAQQVAESTPEVITIFEEAKDDQPEKLGVKEQQMYWMAIKALQEAQVRIEQLEAKVAALEAG